MANIDVRLECDCFVTLKHTSVVLRDDVPALCRYHGYQQTKRVYGQQWRALCMNCRAVYWTRDNETQANRLARQHRYNRGHQDVEVSYEDKIKPRSKAQILIDRAVAKAADYDTIDLFNQTETGADDPPPF